MAYPDRGDRGAAQPDARSRRYTIRYRRRNHAGHVALLVEDTGGSIYLFSDGVLRARWAERDAKARLGQVAASEGGWISVPRVAPYSVDELRQLTATRGRHAERAR